ncbi:Pls/PosA family non-ribosomal peptide synthetase [Geodermatophilus sp. URMC 61]|uniref:Pls/PosA family non-ribosomal peptide synthetase n=1 Tax=Geodermatophilus sp. URMC 61 TaxID=3423411 RepID=UPI00406C24A2
MDLVSAGSAAPARPADPVLTGYAAVLAEVLQVDTVDPDAHVFEDLGADSMVMARFCARVRKRADLPAVSIKDVYAHPTLRGLAGALAPAPAVAPAADPVASGLAEVLAEVLQVDSVDPDAHVFEDLGADSMVMARFCARVRKRADLPAVSIKDVYAHPTLRGLAGALAPAPAGSPVQDGLAAVLAEVLQMDTVDPDAHVFEDLGADSMVMARFCARVRKRADLPAVSIKDVYAHPTLRGLATALAPTAPAEAEAPVPADVSAVAASEPVARASAAEYVATGAMQVALFLAYTLVMGAVLQRGFDYIWAGGGLLEDYRRAALVGAVTFVLMCTLPILVKWLLIGRWRPQQIRIWSAGYLRFWFVKTLVAANPLVLFAGSPLYSLYLRALGAKVGRGVVVFSRHVPVCTDLLTIGDGTVIEKDGFLCTHRAVDGVIQTGRVTIGRNAFIGEKSVLDIETSMGDGAQLGHASSLQAGQAVPAGEHWHGSPGEPTQADYRGVAPADCGTWRRARYAGLQLLYLFGLYLPLSFGVLAYLLTKIPWMAQLLEGGPLAFTSASFYGVALLISLVLFFGGMLLSLLVVMVVPRLLDLVLEPDRVYPLYGIHYVFHRAISRLTNRKFFHEVFGDSSYIVPYLSALGYRLKPVVQTGSNFGTEVKHDSPYLSHIGRGTVVASGISIVNANYSSTSFSVSPTRIGGNNFLGNDIVYPPQGRTGDNCLLATKVLVPIDGPVREGVGLLGSPAFQIPRSVARDDKFIRMAHDEQFPQRLAAKNRHNLVSIALFLLSRWVFVFALTLIGFSMVDLYDSLGAGAIALANVAWVLFTICYFAFVERASTGFKGVRPKYCSIYDVDFWRTERFFKLCARANVHRLMNGTPFKSLLWRMVGVRVGKRLYDEGAGMSEKNIVTIGDDVILNAGAYIQCHSQEDYAFKSDATTIGSGCTIGVATMVHYGVTVGDGAVIGPESFLMKGEEVPAGARWGGNPAAELDPIPLSVFALPAPTPPAELGTPDDDALNGQDTQNVEEFMELFGKDGDASAVPVPRRGGRHRATQRHLAESR